MKITFIINEPIRRASGGYKVVYEYANALHMRGNKVEIVYRCKRGVLFSNYNFPWVIKIFLAKCIAALGPNWFKLKRGIRRRIVLDINDNTINNSDVLIATAVDTAKKVNNLSNSKGKKVYFIQGYETWVYPKEKVHETYSYDMTKVVVAKWLKELVDNYSDNQSYYIPNGVDKEIYKVIVPIESRDRYSISMMYHNLENKGSADGIKVLMDLKKRYPYLKVNMFGIPEKPKDLPEWIEYTCCASQEEVVEIYNKSAIFLCSSWSEGFGLTGAEAMMCGCALVSTETLGVKEYTDEISAKLAPIRDIDSLIKLCVNLIENDEQRISMAKIGQQKVAEKLNVNNSYMLFCNLLNN